MNKTGLLGALALYACSAFAQADDASLRIGIEAAYPPFSYRTPEGELAGFDYDIGNALCAQMQVRCQWVIQEFDGMIPSLKVRKIDAVLSSMSITEDRLKSVDFTDKYYQTPGKFAMKAGSRLDTPVVDLKGRKVGVQRSSTYDRFATEQLEPAGVEIVRYASQNEAFLDLVSGRLDATLADIVNTEESFIKTPAGQGFALVGPDIGDPHYFGRGAGIAVRKGDAANLARLNAAIAAIRANGTYQQVQRKYFPFDIYGQ
ncbi:lysine/arginine/ornithine ABC transporter substrate-binding protein [Pseudomonas maumuensis]|uniref:Lysine/arginine/ornithine ABC transporter substrate-binding protein n=1 Tax=Pseudomonas maumuensis TaxID=2842354 RepID=A0ABX8NS65_9PSED|nr:lysine/arginine/ornithine ABC transporter substrate-binding protein [Pseudomonas maumuensis]QXH58935.1 lysine/arginine/ornithine ABC transporter substrate-binding protein [Pseudomonas maumuensis]